MSHPHLGHGHHHAHGQPRLTDPGQCLPANEAGNEHQERRMIRSSRW